jgi:oligopeptide transport system substrate-binding protein
MLGWLLSGAAGLAACGGDSPAGPRAQPLAVGTALAADQTVTRALQSAPRTLDPTLSTDVYGQEVIDDLFEGLTTIGPDGGLVPGVATSWETSADGRTWTFHLRPEARWSNGDPVTAADFLYAWRRQVDPKTGSEYAQALAPIVGAMDIATGHAPVESLGVSAPDPHTLRVSLVSPTPYLLALVADNYLQPLHRATLDEFGDDWSRPEHMVSNGPFMLKEFIIGDRITLEKNPRYWAAATVHATRVVYYPLDSVIQISRYMAGDIQISDIFPSDQFQWLKSQLGDQVHTGPYLGIQQIVFNMIDGPFAHDRNIRQALTMAVDRRVLADKVRQGVQEPAFTLVPPLVDYHQPIPAWANWSDVRRHAEARRLYAAAGYSPQKPLRVQLLYSTDPQNRDLYDAVAAMWRTTLGAEVEPYNEEFRVYLQDAALHKAVLLQTLWIGDFPDPFTFLQLFQSGFEQNFGGLSDQRFDALLAAAANEPDNERRYRLFEQAETRLNDEADNIPLLYFTSRHLIKPYLKGWHLNLLDRIPSRYLYVLEHQGR